MKTTEKIAKLGLIYKQACGCRDAIDVIQGCWSSNLDELEELLDFARKVSTEWDKTMQDVINAMRAVLENEVHTAAGR